MTALAVASTAAAVVTEVRASKSQTKAIKTQLAQTNIEIDQKATTELNDRQRATRREQARVKVAAGEAGLQLGGSIDLLLADSLMQSGLAAERTNQNADNERLNATAEANSMLSRVETPSLLGAGLRLATAGMSGYATGRNLQVNRTNAKRNAVAGG